MILLLPIAELLVDDLEVPTDVSSNGRLRIVNLTCSLVNDLELVAQVGGPLSVNHLEGGSCLLDVLGYPVENVSHLVAVDVGKQLVKVFKFLLNGVLLRLLHLLETSLLYPTLPVLATLLRTVQIVVLIVFLAASPFCSIS